MRTLICIEADIPDEVDDSPHAFLKYIDEHRSAILSIGTKGVEDSTVVVMTDQSPSWGFVIRERPS
jgi:hypothetical protein